MSDCGICGRTIALKGNFNQHVKQVHNKEKNYRCEDCGRAFARGNDMGRHRERVHGSGPVVTTHTRTVTRVETKDRVETVTRSETKFETKPPNQGGSFGPPKPSARPKSRGSRGERDVEHALHDNGVGYIREKTFNGLVGLGGGSLRYDFAVPVWSPKGLLGGAQKGPSPVEKHFLLIEYDGRQHFFTTRWG